uniref:Uncharacterized protein n=1 Tax=Cucumis melo TaxID=3656 RepID=A0A9I9DYP0_CUCME
MISDLQFHSQKLHFWIPLPISISLYAHFLSWFPSLILLTLKLFSSPTVAVFLFNFRSIPLLSRQGFDLRPVDLTKMDFARCTDESKESENLSTKCCSKVETQLEIVELRVPIEPSTPDADRESGERIEAPLESSDSFDPLCSPRTPKDGVFDPFSPAPAHLALAPISRKYFSGSVGFVPRRLQFGSSSSSLQLVEAEEEQSISDSELLEAVYENLLEVIVSHQAESSLAQPSSSQSDSPDCNTPPTSFLSGVAQTCPAAPVKPSRKLRNLDMGRDPLVEMLNEELFVTDWNMLVAIEITLNY